LLNGKWQHTLAIIKAHFAFYRILFGEKSGNETEKTIPTNILMRSVTFDYFLFGKKKFSDLDLKIPNRASVSSEVLA